MNWNAVLFARGRRLAARCARSIRILRCRRRPISRLSTSRRWRSRTRGCRRAWRVSRGSARTVRIPRSSRLWRCSRRRNATARCLAAESGESQVACFPASQASESFEACPESWYSDSLNQDSIAFEASYFARWCSGPPPWL